MVYMKTVKNIVLLIIPFLVSACATINTYQSKCERRYGSFPQMVDCLKASVSKDFRYQVGPSSDLAKLYIAAAEKLAEDVKRGKISDKDARLLLASLYVELKSKEIQRNQQGYENYLLWQMMMRSSQPRPSYQVTNCQWIGGYNYSCITR